MERLSRIRVVVLCTAHGHLRDLHAIGNVETQSKGGNIDGEVQHPDDDQQDEVRDGVAERGHVHQAKIEKSPIVQGILKAHVTAAQGLAGAEKPPADGEAMQTTELFNAQASDNDPEKSPDGEKVYGHIVWGLDNPPRQLVQCVRPHREAHEYDGEERGHQERGMLLAKEHRPGVRECQSMASGQGELQPQNKQRDADAAHGTCQHSLGEIRYLSQESAIASQRCFHEGGKRLERSRLSSLLTNRPRPRAPRTKNTIPIKKLDNE